MNFDNCQNKDGTYTCPNCNKIWKSHRSLAFHYNHCIGKVQVWNKGLTVKDHESIRKISNTLKVRYDNPKERQRLKDIMNALPEESKQRIRIGGRNGGLSSNTICVKRSKNEIHFYTLCKTLLPHLNITNNEPYFDKWDADIIIHDIKVAILWNGPWHYKKLTKMQKLDQVQSRDKIKLHIIELYGYTPYIIKDLGKENLRFVKESFIQFIREFYPNMIDKAIRIANDYEFNISREILDKERIRHAKNNKRLNRDKLILKRAKIISKIHKIRTSSIDFKKDGWLGKVALLIEMNPRMVHKWMKRNMPQFYKTCHHR